MFLQIYNFFLKSGNVGPFILAALQLRQHAGYFVAWFLTFKPLAAPAVAVAVSREIKQQFATN